LQQYTEGSGQPNESAREENNPGLEQQATGTYISILIFRHRSGRGFLERKRRKIL